MFKIVSIVVLLVAWQCIQAKVYTECELANLLNENCIEKQHIPMLACIVDKTSGRNSSKVRPWGNDHWYGLFQLSNAMWCDNGEPDRPNMCRMDCNDLLGNNIKREMNCVRQVIMAEGFHAWAPLNTDCLKEGLPDLSHCDMKCYL